MSPMSESAVLERGVDRVHPLSVFLSGKPEPVEFARVGEVLGVVLDGRRGEAEGSSGWDRCSVFEFEWFEG